MLPSGIVPLSPALRSDIEPYLFILLCFAAIQCEIDYGRIQPPCLTMLLPTARHGILSSGIVLSRATEPLDRT